jgi:hypothetical protein
MGQGPGFGSHLDTASLLYHVSLEDFVFHNQHLSPVQGQVFGFGVWGLGFGVSGYGFRVWVRGFGFKV